MIELNKEKLEEIRPLFRKKIENSEGESLAPWQQPVPESGVYLFPPKNNSESVEFLFLLGALNFSYWQKDESGIYTWGINTSEGKKIVDVFALAYSLADAHGRGWLEYDADFYRNISEKQLKKIFSDRIKNSCKIPLLSWRQMKIQELGRGLKKFSDKTNNPSTALSFISFFNSIPAVLSGLEEYFPYSFGDPFRKLSQLMVKMIIDRRDENMPGDKRFETDNYYRRVANFSGVEKLKAQPDYMLPLFCLRVGLWKTEDTLGNLVARQREIPMDHPYEQKIREQTVKSVEEIAGDMDGNRGLNNCRVDSIMWQTAVEGCFPGECNDCYFRQKCDAHRGKNERLSWTHHLTRTSNY